MKKLIFLFLMCIPLLVSARGTAGCAMTMQNDYSWWIFVYDDIQRPELKYGYVKVWGTMGIFYDGSPKRSLIRKQQSPNNYMNFLMILLLSEFCK